MLRPILIGMNNPVSTAPGHELYPLPEGCTGNRLWKMLQWRVPDASMRDYVETFERRNLVRGVDYDGMVARKNARAVVAELGGSGCTVVLLGRAVQAAFHLALAEVPLLTAYSGETKGLPPLLVYPQQAGGCTWRQIPHPSGRNLFYNDPKNREVVALLLEELYLVYHGLATTKRETARC